MNCCRTSRVSNRPWTPSLAPFPRERSWRWRAAVGCAALAVLAGLAVGCEEVEVDRTGKQPLPLPESARNPRTDIAKVVVLSEPTATDEGHRGYADGVNIICYLFPRGEKSIPSVGKGSFRFEVYEASQQGQPDAPQTLVQQVNVNFDQSLQYAHKNSFGLVVYSFRVPLGPLPSSIGQIYVKGRFFPADGGPEAEPGDSATITRSLGYAPATIGPPPAPTSRPEVRLIQIKPRIHPAPPTTQSSGR